MSINTDINKIQQKINELDIDNARQKRATLLLSKEIGAISTKTSINKNIFGVILKKSQDATNILKRAREQTKL